MLGEKSPYGAREEVRVLQIGDMSRAGHLHQRGVRDVIAEELRQRPGHPVILVTPQHQGRRGDRRDPARQLGAETGFGGGDVGGQGHGCQRLAVVAGPG
jgi:hypothetical protein